MIFTTIDFDRKGKQQGFLQVPYSHNLAGWANIMVPITVIQNGKGPSALLLGGNHGDEYQGQVALMKLARELTPEKVSGRLVIIPSLNFPAARAATRLSPIDGMNMNRAFPGNAQGSVTSMMAHYLTTVLFPLVDIVVDIHSGGRSLLFYPCSHMHLVPDKAQRKKMLTGMLAWNTDFSMLYTDIAGSGLLPSQAEGMGKIVITTELGGGESISAEVHRIAQQGLLNVLRTLKMVEGPVETRESMGKPPAILVQALNRDDYLLAPESGVFEVEVDLGQYVETGQPVGAIHFLERPDREPERIMAKTSGYVMAMRAPCMTQQGDCVVVLAEAVDRKKVEEA